VSSKRTNDADPIPPAVTNSGGTREEGLVGDVSRNLFADDEATFVPPVPKEDASWVSSAFSIGGLTSSDESSRPAAQSSHADLGTQNLSDLSWPNDFSHHALQHGNDDGTRQQIFTPSNDTDTLVVPSAGSLPLTLEANDIGIADLQISELVPPLIG